MQFRFSEALTVLPVFTPAAVPGLALGCFLANLGSPLGIVDWVFGTGATLLAAIGTWLVGRVPGEGRAVLAPLPRSSPTWCWWDLSSPASPAPAPSPSATLPGPPMAPPPCQWASGELVVCYALGIPLLMLLKRAGAGTSCSSDLILRCSEKSPCLPKRRPGFSCFIPAGPRGAGWPGSSPR